MGNKYDNEFVRKQLYNIYGKPKGFAYEEFSDELDKMVKAFNEQSIENDNFKKEYHKKHKLCPKCGASQNVTTLIAYVLYPDKKEEYKDLLKLKDLTYSTAYINDGASKKDLSLDVIFHKRTKELINNKCILLIHGGNFESGSKEDSNIVELANYLANKDYVCFIINYRLKKDNPPVPLYYKVSEIGPSIHASTVDVKTALRYITANCKNYGIDLNYINVLGESAGSVAMFGASLSESYHFYKDKKSLPIIEENNNINTNFTINSLVNLWGSAYLVANKFSGNTPPILTIHGTKDKKLGVSFAAASFIDKKCKELNIEHEFYPVNTGHGAWDIKINNKNINEIIYNFLEKYN